MSPGTCQSIGDENMSEIESFLILIVLKLEGVELGFEDDRIVPAGCCFVRWNCQLPCHHESERDEDLWGFPLLIAGKQFFPSFVRALPPANDCGIIWDLRQERDEKNFRINSKEKYLFRLKDEEDARETRNWNFHHEQSDDEANNNKLIAHANSIDTWRKYINSHPENSLSFYTARTGILGCLIKIHYSARSLAFRSNFSDPPFISLKHQLCAPKTPQPELFHHNLTLRTIPSLFVSLSVPWR